MQIIFSCSGIPFVYAFALGIVGAAKPFGSNGIVGSSPTMTVRTNGAERRNPREWLCHSRNEFTDGKLAKARPVAMLATGNAQNLLLQIFCKKVCKFIKRNGIVFSAVVQICVTCTRNNYQLLVVACEPLKGIFAKVAGVSFFAVKNHYGTLDFFGIGKKNVVGYEIPFTRYFYKYEAPKPSAQIMDEIKELEKNLSGSLTEIFGE